MLEFVDVSLGYSDAVLVHKLSFQLSEGQSMSMLGGSGLGKSTILNAIMGFIKPRQGIVKFDGIDLSRLRGAEKRKFLSWDLGIVFQNQELIADLLPLENVVLPGLIAQRSRQELNQQGEQLLNDLGITDLTRPSCTYSGGEQQRIAIARALINQPKLVIADEPTGSLDTEIKAGIEDVLHDIPKKHGASLLYVTHDEAFARKAYKCVRLVKPGTDPATLVLVE